ncbi:hypothetical protein BU25DRAFT_50745 [Macroventuria anomochaeta]|uniref:Uncharacterized protein n=1 Tax=Macroventuria anomochaeta TaxID=301207 RepID=A0ACB6S253_9PLEO|nr:uncharacterized protein BU25DRAFT_50745 [Macroventuria anomochaeta]KAF2627597.1 hypothetical protein BU25DRAFT_50745 [Macroventuria anomochaeta]
MILIMVCLVSMLDSDNHQAVRRSTDSFTSSSHPIQHMKSGHLNGSLEPGHIKNVSYPDAELSFGTSKSTSNVRQCTATKQCGHWYTYFIVSFTYNFRSGTSRVYFQSNLIVARLPNSFVTYPSTRHVSSRILKMFPMGCFVYSQLFGKARWRETRAELNSKSCKLQAYR